MDDFLAQFVPEAKARRAEAMAEVERIDAFLALAERSPAARQARRGTNGSKSTPAPAATGTLPGQRPSDDMIDRVRKYIVKHPSTTIAEMAKHLKAHENTIRRSVKVLQIEQGSVKSLGRAFEDRREHFAPTDWTPSETQEAAPVAA